MAAENPVEPVSLQRPRLDLDAAIDFLRTVPEGRWTSYGDVAVAAGRTSSAGQPVASCLGSKGHFVPHVHRVLNNCGEIGSADRLPRARAARRLRAEETPSGRG
jgi:alkylated DNA nucleotide flippase Atl1